VGDIISEPADLGYWRTLCICVGIIAAAAVVWAVGELYFPSKTWISILTFWIVYITTRPLGASVGDLLTADPGPIYDDTQCYFDGTAQDITLVTDLNVTSFWFDITTAVDYTLPQNLLNFTAYILDNGVGSPNPIDCTPDDICTVTVDCPTDGSGCPQLFDTCVANLACDQCWGLGAVNVTNAVFGALVITFVIVLMVTKLDRISTEKKRG